MTCRTKATSQHHEKRKKKNGLHSPHVVVSGRHSNRKQRVHSKSSSKEGSLFDSLKPLSTLSTSPPWLSVVVVVVVGVVVLAVVAVATAVAVVSGAVSTLGICVGR